MSTENCKKFIEELSVKENLPLKTKWKRLKKYNYNNLIFRDFENTEGDLLIISETKNGEFQLFSLERNIELPKEILSLQSPENLIFQLYKYVLDFSFSCHLWEGKNSEVDFESFEPLSPQAIRQYALAKDESLLKHELNNNHVFNKYNQDELQKGHNFIYLLEYTQENYVPDAFKVNFVSETTPEAVGIMYDKENVEISLKTIKGLSFLEVTCGGDWEMPIFFLVYWSEEEQRLKGFFPKGDANIYNQEFNTAYGSETENLNRNNFSDDDYDKIEDKVSNLMEKINDNYDQYYNEALNKAVKQLKSILMTESKNKLKL